MTDETRTIHVTVPAPLTHPEQGQKVWLLSPDAFNPITRERWQGSGRQRMLLDRGLLYGTEEEAKAVFRTLYGGASDE